MKKGRFIVVVIICIILYIALDPGKEPLPVEQLDIPSGLGIDLVQNNKGDVLYSIPTSFYIFTPQEKALSKLHEGNSISIGNTREERQLQENNKFILGLEKILVLSERLSRFGIRKPLDALNRNYEINDKAYAVISEQPAKELLALKIEGYPSAADYIEGMIKNSYHQNFFSDNYKLIDILVRIDAEGRNLVLPCMSIREGKPFISSIAIFNKDKMAQKVDIKEAKVMNIMRENTVWGIFFLEKDIRNNIDFFGKTERKVNCRKVRGKYSFNINIKISGNIIANSLYKDIEKDAEAMKTFQRDMEEKVKSMCDEFIKKMQNEYKLDCLELGAVAAAKYGRDSGTDWNEAVSNADIKVNIQIEVDTVGRGEY